MRAGFASTIAAFEARSPCARSLTGSTLKIGSTISAGSPPSPFRAAAASATAPAKRAKMFMSNPISSASAHADGEPSSQLCAIVPPLDGNSGAIAIPAWRQTAGDAPGSHIGPSCLPRNRTPAAAVPRAVARWRPRGHCRARARAGLRACRDNAGRDHGRYLGRRPSCATRVDGDRPTLSGTPSIRRVRSARGAEKAATGRPADRISAADRGRRSQQPPPRFLDDIPQHDRDHAAIDLVDQPLVVDRARRVFSTARNSRPGRRRPRRSSMAISPARRPSSMSWLL